MSAGSFRTKLVYSTEQFRANEAHNTSIRPGSNSQTDGKENCLITPYTLRIHTVTDGDFVYIYGAIFKYQTDLFYCAQDIGR